MWSILIVDDHLLVRIGLKHVLVEEFRGVVFGEAKSADAALALIAKQPWDLVILDLTLPDKDGFYVLQETLLCRPEARVLVLSEHEGHLCAVRARQLGACGFIGKSAGRSELVKAVKSVLAGREYVDETLSAGPDHAVATDHLTLSPREYRVMRALTAGRRTREIATELDLSIKTVGTYKRRILNKMRLQSTADLIRYVTDNRLS